jgi:DNA-binding IclR family transcriptional regulator
MDVEESDARRATIRRIARRPRAATAGSSSARPAAAPGHGPSVTSKVFAILGAFAQGEARLNLTQISQRTGLPIATAHRLASELVRFGGLERERGGTYRVGVRLWEIGSLAPVRGGLRELAMPFMEDLYESTHGNVQLAVRDGDDALILEKISGRDSVSIVTRVGGRLPLHATGVGKVLLAHAPVDAVDRLVAAGLPALTPRTIVDAEKLEACLEEVRRSGYAWTRDEMTLGAVSVGAPVVGPGGAVVAALSIVVDSRAGDIGRLAPPVRAAARGLSGMVMDWWDRIVPAAADLEAIAHAAG